MGRKLTAERQEQRSAAIRLRQAGWSQPEIGRALAVPRETIRDWLKIATDVAGVDRRLYYIANSTKLRIGDNHHQPITLFPCRYEEVGEGIAPESIDLILTDPPYLASAQDITRPWQKTDLRRNYGKWDKTSKREYTHNVTLWTALMERHLKPGGALYCFMDLRQASLWCNAFMKIIKVKKNGRIYHQLYDGNKFVMHIGNAEALRVFNRNVQIGEEAIKYLQKRPYIAPRACLNIIG